ncbi:MAG: sugar phosphate isomerase/epimerase family protein [Candidatus Promineifilaceae bacterium]
MSLPFLFSSGSLWSYAVERCFALAAAAGFDGLELMVDMRWETRQPSSIKALMDRYQLPVRAVHSPFMPSVPGWPHDQPGRILKSIVLADAIGAEVVVHHLPARIGIWWVSAPGRMFPVPGLTNPDHVYKRWLETEYSGVQAGTSVQLCIENLPAFQRFGRRWNYAHWNTPKALARFPNVTLDTTHLGTWGLEPADVYPALNEQVKHVHLSNYDGREHLRPEAGRLALDSFLAQLAAEEYSGAVSLELQPEALDAGQPDDHVRQLMEGSLAFCRRAAGGPS